MRLDSFWECQTADGGVIDLNIEQEVLIFDGEGNPVKLPLRSLILRRGPDLEKLMRELKFESSFKDPDFEIVLERMLERIPNNLDKRQGSIIYDALAPAAVELTEALIEREANRALSYASMSNGQWLDLRVAEHGITRMKATKALRAARFYADEDKSEAFLSAPIGGRYSVPNEYVNYIITADLGGGQYEMRCEEAGQIGNRADTGTLLLPVEYLPGLALVELGEILSPGEEEEDDNALYERFVRSITRPPFGGNRADYEEYFRTIEGIGSVKLFRADPEKGHVRAIILGADWEAPNFQLVDKAQTMVDPFLNHGEGIGMAPMAHIVHVEGAVAQRIDIEAKLVLIRGWSIGQVQQGVNEAIERYFLELRKHWADYVALDSPDYMDTVIRVAQLESEILEVEGIADIIGTKIDGLEANLTLSTETIPVVGNISIGV